MARICATEQERDEEIIIRTATTKTKDLFETTTTIADRMKGSIHDRLEQCIMSINLEDRVKMGEEAKEIEICPVPILNI